MKYILLILTFWVTILNGLSISDIQYTTDPADGTYPSYYEGQTVTTGGIVTGTDYSNGRFFIESSSGGPWSGIYIYNNDYNVSQGDSIVVTGEVYEYYGFTEISPAYDLEVISSGNPLPPCTLVSTWDVMNLEEYESVLVQLNDVAVTQEYDEWSEWDVDDGSGSCIISIGFLNLEEMEIPILMNYPFEYVRGIISYTWGEFQLNPRSLNDLQSAEGNFIISVSDQYIFSSQEFEVPIDLSFLGETQQVQNYQFSLEFNNEVVEYTGFSVENTLSESGSVELDLPIEGVIEVSYTGEFTFNGIETLLNLNFQGISSGSAELQFSDFTIDDFDIEFISEGEIYIQTEALPIGDTLTIIQKPILNIPEIVIPGEEFVIECLVDQSTTGWFAELKHSAITLPLPILGTTYDNELERWFLTTSAPETELYELYDLVIGASNLETDTTKNAVRIIPEYRTNYSFVHITDTHLPTHIYTPDPESLTDTSEMEDLREVIRDINLINPEFVLLTGDLVNEGEMEDFENRRVYTKAQQILTEFEVPVFLVAGNHDIGGWYDSPPSQGTARREWWRFFGWKWLQDPPDVAPYYTQNFSFDYGSEHFTGMESYENYDDYMQNIYGDVSFTYNQIEWLEADLDNSASENKVVFYHMDFDEQIDLDAMGIDMVLYGHIHSNSGSIYDPPYNLSTEGTCDGERAYRIINVNDGVLSPQNTVSAGWSGDNLQIDFFPDNDGTADSITANISNLHPLMFNDALIKFLIPFGEYEYSIINGELVQIDSSSDPQIVYISTDIPANDDISVTLTAEPVNPTSDEQIPVQEINMINYPNPFNPSTTISFTFTTEISENTELGIYNIKGQKIRVYSLPFDSAQGDRELEYYVIWNGTDEKNEPVPSGIYFYKLKTGKQELTKKMVLMK